MSGMAVAGVWNPKSVGVKLRSRGFRGERALKKEEKRAMIRLKRIATRVMMTPEKSCGV
jgi:hypothetical protein